MEKIRISESQFRKMVREEGEKIKKEILLRAQLEKIDQELAKLSEVHAGGNMEPGKDGVHAGQKKPVFTKKGTHLVEDETEEMGSEENPMDSVEETPAEESVETLSKSEVMDAIQDLGNKLDLTGTVEFTGDEESPEESGIEGADDNIELDVDVENGADDVEGSEMAPEDGEAMDVSGTEDELEECGDGTQMEEKKEEVMEKTEVVAESIDPKKKKLNEERERMKFLAGLK